MSLFDFYVQAVRALDDIGAPYMIVRAFGAIGCGARAHEQISGDARHPRQPGDTAMRYSKLSVEQKACEGLKRLIQRVLRM